MVRLAIIGTAGRNEDASKMTPELFRDMVAYVCSFFDNFYNDTKFELVSGGAAWADHVAVAVYNYYAEVSGGPQISLDLHLPAKFKTNADRFSIAFNEEFERARGWTCGETLNHYHEQFSRVMGGSSMGGITRAIENGAFVYQHSGFKKRNHAVGKADYLLAFTWGDGKIPKPGGTMHTWYNSSAETKTHVPLKGLRDVIDQHSKSAQYRKTSKLISEYGFSYPPEGIVRGFFGEYRWLSNFWPSPMVLNEKHYPTVEHAYQASKTKDLDWRQRIREAPTPKDAKRLARKAPIRSDWNDIRFKVMGALVHKKFELNIDLACKLRMTAKMELEETNFWGDRFWGVYEGRGENRLGKILMRIREGLNHMHPGVLSWTVFGSKIELNGAFPAHLQLMSISGGESPICFVQDDKAPNGIAPVRAVIPPGTNKAVWTKKQKVG